MSLQWWLAWGNDTGSWPSRRAYLWTPLAPGKGRTKACETLKLQPHTNAAKVKTRMMAFFLEGFFLCCVGCARKREGSNECSKDRI